MTLDFLASQQACLKSLGFYNGEINGVWDEATSNAQLSFTSTSKAIPCQATNRPFTRHQFPDCYRLVSDGAKTYFQLVSVQATQKSVVEPIKETKQEKSEKSNVPVETDRRNVTTLKK